MQKYGGGKKAAADIAISGRLKLVMAMALVLDLVVQVLSYCRTTFANSSWKFINSSERC